MEFLEPCLFYSVGGIASADLSSRNVCLNLYSIFCLDRRWTVRIFTTLAAHFVSSTLS